MTYDDDEIDKELQKQLATITETDEQLSLQNLLESKLKFGKTNHVFISYHSKTSSKFARTLQASLKECSKSKFGKELVVCNHEEDFIPGRTILQNITTSVRESIKVILVITEAFIKSQWCSFEAEYTLSLKLDMKESKTILPLLTDTYSRENMPVFLRSFDPIDCTVSANIWYPELIEALNIKIKLWERLENPQELCEGKQFHFLTFRSNAVDSQFDVSIDEMLKELAEAGFKGEILIVEELQKQKPFEVVEKIVDSLNTTSKVLIFSYENISKNKFYLGLIKLVKMYIEDKRITTTYIIPIKLDEEEFPVFGESISYLDAKRGGYLERLKDAIAREGEYRFCFPHEAIISYHNGMFRIADFECLKLHDDEQDPRILDMCFVTMHRKPFLILIDADNLKIKLASVLGDEVLNGYTFPNSDERPNRLSKINDDSFAVIYENKCKIAIFTVNKESLVLSKDININDCNVVIKGLIAFSDEEFLITNGAKCFHVNVETSTAKPLGQSPHIETSTAEPLRQSPEMSLARRLTKSPNNDIFIADENDRRLIWLDQTGKQVFTQDKWNRNLYNVRGISAGKNKIYAAVNNGITVFKYSRAENDKFMDNNAVRIIQFQRPVDHNRALCLDNSEKFLALSQVINGIDIIRIFQLHK